MRKDDQTIPELDAAGLRRFGITLSVIIVVLFGLLLPLLFGYRSPMWPWPVAVALLLWAMFAPRSLNALYRPWMRVGLALNRIMTPIVMSIVFYLVITPTSFIMRMIGRDPMSRNFDTSASTYRLPKHKPPRKNLERPY